MHLSPLTGIETSFTVTVTELSAMHLSPLTGIETIFPSQSSIGRAWMHLSPLTGIETGFADSLRSLITWMHLSPLTGIETVVSHVVARKPQNDASFTPYGD